LGKQRTIARYQCRIIHNKEEINFADLGIDELIFIARGFLPLPKITTIIQNQSAFKQHL